jgi:hypothetical protein
LESGNLSPPETALYHFSAPQVVQVNNSFQIAIHVHDRE